MKYAICTLVMHGDAYIPGAVALAKSIRYFTQVDIICMVTSDVKDRKSLSSVYTRVVEVPYIQVTGPKFKTKGATERYSWINTAPTKWNILQFEEYDKVLFLDADMLVQRPIDDLFLLNTPAGSFDGQFNERWTSHAKYGAKVDDKAVLVKKNYYGNLKQGDKVSKDAIEGIYTDPEQYALSGAIVLLKPNKMSLDLFKQDASIIISKLPTNITSGIDEILITLFYHIHGYTWTHISIEYNVSVLHLYPIFQKNSRILHFLSKYKPWYIFDTKGRVETRSSILSYWQNDNSPYKKLYSQVYSLWWDIYEDKYVPVKSTYKDHIKTYLAKYIGSTASLIIEKYYPFYLRCVTHRSYNPISNYELLEAYGDRFMSAAFSWILSDIPTIVSPKQLDVIIKYLENKNMLKKVFDDMKLSPYLLSNDPIDMKVQSDVIEALIGAIGFSYEAEWNAKGKKDHMNGDWAVRSFVRNAFTMIDTLEPEKYDILYDNPKTAIKNQIEQAYLDRTEFEVSSTGNIKAEKTMSLPNNRMRGIVSYKDTILGESNIDTLNMYEKDARKEAIKEAYRDALKKQSVQKLVQTLQK